MPNNIHFGAAPQRNSKLANTISTDFVKLYAATTAWGNMLPMAMLFPNLRGLWSMSSVDEALGVYDYSSQGRKLSSSATPTFVFSGLIPYVNLVRASSQALYRANENGINIASSLYALSWCYFDTESTGNATGIMAKYYTTGNLISWAMYKSAADAFTFDVSTDGTAAAIKTVNDGTVNYAISRWFCVAAIFKPSTSIKLFVNGNWYTNTTSIPATIFQSTQSLDFGSYNRTNYLDGRLSTCLLGADDGVETIIEAFYYHTKALYGV